MRALRLGALVVLAGCLDVSVPQRAPPPGAGTIQGTVTYPVPGRATTRPAGGATVTLVGTSRQAVADAESGRFLLEGVTQSEGQLLFSYNADRDGTIEVLQKVLDVSKLGAGRGKSVALGEVVLGKRGAVQGRVLRADVSGPTGHAGTSVFVDRLPLAAVTTDTGEFLLENLPEGPVTVSFFRAGYLPDSVKLEVRSGREESITPVRLKVDPMALAAPAARVTGTLRFEDEAPVAAARVKFLSGAQRFEATTSAAGELESELGQAALYQVLIEADGAQSLILYNVLLLPGANALGTIPLTRGTSTPIGFDGGFNPGTPTIAVIDPLELVVPPGGTGVLSSARSTGQKPVTSRWSSSVADGGLRLLFEQAETKGLTTRFTAPDASVAFNVTLNVTDDRGNTSTATSTVRVGLAPSVKVSVDGGSSDFEVSDVVTLEADGTVSDGSQVTEYQWVQVTGPTIQGISATTGSRLSFMAPPVSSVAPMTFEVRAASEIGISSEPAPVTIFVRPRGMLLLDVNADKPKVTWTGVENSSQRSVKLTARLRGAPPGNVDYTWSPTLAPDCALPDAGGPPGCLRPVQLSASVRPDAGFAEFTAPPVSGTQTLRFSVTARFMGLDGGLNQLTRTAGVEVVDLRTPECSAERSRLTYRVNCDEPLSAGEYRPDGGLPQAATIINRADGDGGLAVFLLESAPEYSTLLDVAVRDLADNGANAPLTETTPTNGEDLFLGPVLTATSLGLAPADAGAPAVSESNPRPTWVTPPASAGGPAERFVMARRTANNQRSVWLAAELGCATTPCNAPDLRQINGVGTEPGGALSAVTAGNSAYLITSSGTPSALVRVRGRTAFEFPVMNMPPLLGLSAVGNELWILSSTDAGAFFRQRVDELSDGGVALSRADVIVDGGYDGQAIDVFTSPDLSRIYAGLSLEGLPPKFDLFRSSPGAAGWVSFGTVFGLDEPVSSTRCTVLDGPSDQTPLCLASCGSRTGPRGLRLFYENYMGFPTLQFIQEDSEEIDVVRLGNTALGAWTTPGERRLGLIHVVLPPPSMPIPPSFRIVVEPRSRAVTSAYTPRLAVMNGEVLLTWSEMLSPNGPWVIRAQVIH